MKKAKNTVTRQVQSSLQTTDIVEFVDNLFKDRGANGVSVRDCFMAATSMEEFLRLFHERAVVQASLHVPDAIEALGNLAKQGDIEASKLLLEIAGMSGKDRGGVMNAIQINITAQEQAQLERDFADEFGAEEGA